MVTLSVASGIVFLSCLRSWVRAECTDEGRRAAALLLAGSCGPFLILFSDIAEPQLAAAIAVAGLAYARMWRDDEKRDHASVIYAILAIAIASLIYQGMLLAFGMLPLVVSSRTLGVRRIIVAAAVAILGVTATMIGAQTAVGVRPGTAAVTAIRGEQNPLTRSLMASGSPVKYLSAAVAGPPQGIVALENFSGLRTLVSSLVSRDRSVVVASAKNLLFLLVGVVITATLFLKGVRDRHWRVLGAAAILLALPILRNQQYAYVKFYILWPIPVALLATHCRPRTILTAALIVLGLNGWLVIDQIRQGRGGYAVARSAYVDATASTCWLTSGWTPPFAYLWPGTATPILGTLATGADPDVQRARLTASLHHCFCESTSVWTDTMAGDREIVRAIGSHFNYRAVDLAALLIDQSGASGHPLPGVLAYSDASKARACEGVRRGSNRGQTAVKPGSDGGQTGVRATLVTNH